mmetsp:Transcript_7879/g.23875  ORF Transcript_7879/g.23875 Transcript_7879/m.23875 type:complete len:225 (+) Transcript_7879:3037-3711(+)
MASSVHKELPVKSTALRRSRCGSNSAMEQRSLSVATPPEEPMIRFKIAMSCARGVGTPTPVRHERMYCDEASAEDCSAKVRVCAFDDNDAVGLEPPSKRLAKPTTGGSLPLLAEWVMMLSSGLSCTLRLTKKGSPALVRIVGTYCTCSPSAAAAAARIAPRSFDSVADEERCEPARRASSKDLADLECLSCSHCRLGEGGDNGDNGDSGAVISGRTHEANSKAA